MSADDDLNPFSAVPLFPLPSVVLFPRAVLPLHIFEERFKAMTAAALVGNRQIAMALLKPGWERDYYQRPAIEPVVCIGTILTHEKLPDGKYNFLLQGHTRARVVDELVGKPYRVATLEPIAETEVMEIDLESERQRLAELFEHSPLATLPTAAQFREIIGGPLPTSDVVDLVAFNLIDDLPLKQSLLADGDVRGRIARTLDAVARLHPPVPAAYFRLPTNPSAN
jgi:Lon protease-like protein